MTLYPFFTCMDLSKCGLKFSLNVDSVTKALRFTFQHKGCPKNTKTASILHPNSVLWPSIPVYLHGFSSNLS